MELEQIVPDSVISDFIRLGNADTKTAWAIADKMVLTWGHVVVKYPDYPKQKFYKAIAQWLGGKSIRQVSNYHRTGEVFPPETRDTDIGFTIHTFCTRFEDPVKILSIASRQAGLIGKCPTLDWLRSATLNDDRLEETEIIQDMTEVAVSGTVSALSTILSTFLERLSLSSEKSARAEALITELLEIISSG